MALAKSYFNDSIKIKNQIYAGNSKCALARSRASPATVEIHLIDVKTLKLSCCWRL